jgi:hypothetical protein
MMRTPLFVISILFATNATAEPQVSQSRPIVGDPLIDFQIESCDAVSGIGMYQLPSKYDGGPLTDYVMSDFCFYPESGSILSFQPTDGLTLVKGDPSIKSGSKGADYELLSDEDRRPLYNIMPMPEPLLCSSDQTGSFWVRQHVPEKYLSTNDNWTGGWLYGVTAGDRQSKDTLPLRDNYGFFIEAISTDNNERLEYNSRDNTRSELIATFYAKALASETNEQILEITSGDDNFSKPDSGAR